MAGKYGTLTAGQSYLSYFSSLDTTRATQAEKRADLFIDQWFGDYERGLWSPGTAPAGIEELWQDKAEAEYLMLDAAATNPAGGDESTQLAEKLIEKAMIEAHQMTYRGYLIGQDGERQWPSTERGSSTAPLERA